MEIGSYSIPDLYRLPSLINDVRTIYNKFESTEIDLDTLAPILNHKTAKSGAFTSKLASMRAYRLIDGRGKIRVTEIGRKIALPSPDKPDEKNEGLIEAINSIPLWKQLYEKFTKVEKQLPTSDFWVEIRQIASVPPEVAQNKADLVRKSYLEDIREIIVPKGDDKADMAEPLKGQQNAGGAQALISMDTKEMITFADGSLKLTLPKENLKETWEKAKRMIDIYVGSS